MAFFPSQPFQWGSAGQALTPEQVAERQRAAQSMMQAGSDYSPVGHWSQGLARLAQGLIGGYQARQANEAEQAGVASANEAMSPIIAALGGGSMPSMPMASGGTPASVPTGDMAAAIREGLISRGLPDHVADGFVMNFQDESGLNPGINEAAPVVPGSRGGFGLAQWTGPRRVALERFADQRGTAVSDLNTQLDYLMTELAGPEAAAASQIMGAQDTGSAAAAIVNAFLRPAEEHRARRVAEYTGGQGTAYSGVQQPQSGVVSALLAANANPWARQQYGGVIDALLGSEIQRQQQASDPYRQLQIQKAQLELEQARNPAAKAPVFEGGQWWDINGSVPQPLTQSAPDLTTLQQNLAAAGLTPGTPEYQAAIMQAVTKPQTQINMGDGAPGLGKLSTDFGYVLDPETKQPRIDPVTGLPTAAPVPGSPAAIAAAAASEKNEKRDAQAASSASVVLQDIDKAIGQVSAWTAGVGSRLSSIPGTGARDLSGSLDTIKANIGFDRLQQMREASPTGGALGGIAVQELMMLQAVLGSLDQAQSPEQLSQNLQRLKEVYEPIARKAAAYPNAGQYGFGGSGSPEAAGEAQKRRRYNPQTGGFE